MSKLALGTVQFGLDYGISNFTGKVPLKEAHKIINLAKEQSVDTIDTAYSYGDSEKILGDIGVNDFNIVTKTESLQSGVDNVLRSVNQSLKKLKIDKLHGLLIHNINDVKRKQFEFLYSQLNELKQFGIINKIGFSCYEPEQVDFLLDNFDFDLIQIPFNIIDNRLIVGGQLKKLKNRNVEVHARSVFLQGLLLMNSQNRLKKFARWDSLWRLWHEWLEDNRISALQASITYSMSISEISKVVVGIESKKQLDEILRANMGKLNNIPQELFTHDVDLLSPANWDNL